jgi:hypothetical protein
MKNSDMKCVVKSIARKVDSGDYRVSTFSKNSYYSSVTTLPVDNHSIGVFDGPGTLIATSTTFSATLYDNQGQSVTVKWTSILNQAMMRALQLQEEHKLDLDKHNKKRMMQKLIDEHCK